MCVAWHYSWGDMNRNLSTYERKLVTDKSKNTTKTELHEPLNSLGKLTWVLVRVHYSTGNDFKDGGITEASQMGGSSWNLEPETPNTTCGQRLSLPAALLVCEYRSVVLTGYISLGREALRTYCQFQRLLKFPNSWKTSCYDRLYHHRNNCYTSLAMLSNLGDQTEH